MVHALAAVESAGENFYESTPLEKNNELLAILKIQAIYKRRDVGV